MIKDHLLDSYDYNLPEELIAQRPIDQTKRDLSKLLIYKIETNEIIHDYFYNISDYLPEDSTLVFNQSKVFASRIKAKKESGGQAEIFLLSLVATNDGFHSLIKTRSKKKVGDIFKLNENQEIIISKVYDDGTFAIKFFPEMRSNEIINFLDQNAQIPIPPYIRKGESDEKDKKNYQTIYAKDTGSVAAPTAGLHFTAELLTKLENIGLKKAFVTLHVGLGTFKPVTVSDLSDHKMHTEKYFIDKKNLKEIKSAKKIISVGTTTLRVLESSFNKEIIENEIYETNIFLRPGSKIESINGLITNFHLPKSTLLILVSALVGREKCLELYRIAVENKYRFFSYGDAMLILK